MSDGHESHGDAADCSPVLIGDDCDVNDDGGW